MKRGKLLYPERPTKRNPRPRGPELGTVEQVLRRDDGKCVVCGDDLYGERAFNWSIHHRRGRDGKVDSNRPQNLISVCGSDNQSGCHGRIHQRRSESQPAGWWLSRIAGTDPLMVPVLVVDRWVYLTDDGRYADAPAVVA